MRALIYSDIHYCEGQSLVDFMGDKYSARIHNCIQSLNWVEDMAKKLDCDEIICGGDFFNSPRVTAQEISALNEINKSDIKHVYLLGNHEAERANLSYSVPKMFGECNVVDKITRCEINEYVDLYYLPYCRPERAPSLNDIIVDKSKKNIFISHNDIKGLNYGMYKSKYGYDLDEINSMSYMFINGHLHNKVDTGRLKLIGNLTGLNLTEDANLYKHVALLLTIDGDTVKLEEFENPYALNFYKLTVDDVKILDCLKDNACVAITCDDTYVDEVKTAVNKNLNIVAHRISIRYKAIPDVKIQDENNIDADKSAMQIFKECCRKEIDNSIVLEDEFERLGNAI